MLLLKGCERSHPFCLCTLSFPLYPFGNITIESILIYIECYRTGINIAGYVHCPSSTGLTIRLLIQHVHCSLLPDITGFMQPYTYIVRLYTYNKSQYKLKPIEAIVWHTIKGILSDYQMNIEGDPVQCPNGVNPLGKIHIVVKPLDEDRENRLTVFKITPSPVGLLDDVQRLFKSFLPNMQAIQGNYNKDTKETVIIIQQFELRLEHFSGIVMRTA